MRLIIWFAIFAVYSAIAGCQPNSQAQDSEFPVSFTAACNGTIQILDQRTLRFCGETTSENVEMLLRTFNSGDYSALVIDSFGGHTTPAIKLGQFLNRNDVTLFVNHICLSSCAQFVLIGAQRLHLRDNSIVGMHDSQTATNTLVGTENVRSGMAEHAQEEKAFYNQVGAPEWLLIDPLRRTNPRCLVDIEAYKQSGGLRLRSDFDYYIPDRAFMLKAFPGQLMTDWPTLEAVALRLQETTLDFDFQLSQVAIADQEFPLKEC